jgi:hypothetical protein
MFSLRKTCDEARSGHTLGALALSCSLGVVAVRGAVFVFILSFYLFAAPIADTALFIYSMAQALKPVAERFMTPLPSRRASATAY